MRGLFSLLRTSHSAFVLLLFSKQPGVNSMELISDFLSLSLSSSVIWTITELMLPLLFSVAKSRRSLAFRSGKVQTFSKVMVRVKGFFPFQTKEKNQTSESSQKTDCSWIQQQQQQKYNLLACTSISSQFQQHCFLTLWQIDVHVQIGGNYQMPSRAVSCVRSSNIKPEIWLISLRYFAATITVHQGRWHVRGRGWHPWGCDKSEEGTSHRGVTSMGVTSQRGDIHWGCVTSVGDMSDERDKVRGEGWHFPGGDTSMGWHFPRVCMCWLVTWPAMGGDKIQEWESKSLVKLEPRSSSKQLRASNEAQATGATQQIGCGEVSQTFCKPATLTICFSCFVSSSKFERFCAIHIRECFRHVPYDKLQRHETQSVQPLFFTFTLRRKKKTKWGRTKECRQMKFREPSIKSSAYAITLCKENIPLALHARLLALSIVGPSCTKNCHFMLTCFSAASLMCHERM